MVEGTITNVIEDERTYYFPNGKVELQNVMELLVRPSGTHRLKTKDGTMHIIPTGWLHIAIKSPNNWVV